MCVGGGGKRGGSLRRRGGGGGGASKVEALLLQLGLNVRIFTGFL